MRFISDSVEETVRLGQTLGGMLKTGQTVCFSGELGAGKTTFIKGIARAFGIEERDITSASFTIVAEHDSKPPLYHIDLYRLETGSDIESSGVYDFIGGDGISVVEWAEKLGQKPEKSISVDIGFVSENKREILIEGIPDDLWISAGRT